MSQMHYHTQLVVAPKSTTVAYLLWFFLGSLGIHKFYLNQNKMGSIFSALVSSSSEVAGMNDSGEITMRMYFCFCLLYGLRTMKAKMFIMGSRES